VRRITLSLSALTAASLLLTACGGSSTSNAGNPDTLKGGQTLTQYWPLTGLKVASNKTATLDHPVLVA
jgi:ABC-type glycerol-3-phosphate transport system substrate-binding protein